MAALQSHDTNRKWMHKKNKSMRKRNKDLETEQRQKYTQITRSRSQIYEVKLLMDDPSQSDFIIHQFNANTQL